KVRTNSQQVNQITGAIVTGSDLNLSPLFSSNGLVGYWKFDEGQGTSTQDSSGNGNTGTLSASPPGWVSGKVGDALQFNGSTNNVAMANNITLNSNFTISFWFDPTANAGGYDCHRPQIISKHSSSACTTDSWGVGYSYHATSGYYDKKITVNWGNGTNWNTFLSSQQIPQNKWTYVVWVMNSGVSYLYINGVLDSTVSTPNMVLSNSYTLLFGKVENIYYTGLSDDIRIYNRALSAAEISALYNATK
ncbi:MAG TPA: LamG domain-containing protein, partial [Candidatus Paceibacterota bacterium]|nr:LamG domain-containing protein [Candidatus Paceibacterota bacterium]